MKSANRISYWVDCKKEIEDDFKVLALEVIGRIKLLSAEIGKTLGRTGLAGELGFSHLKVWMPIRIQLQR